MGEQSRGDFQPPTKNVEVITDPSRLVEEIKRYKYLKSDNLENQDNEQIAKELEESGDKVEASLRVLLETDIETAQQVIHDSFNAVSFDPVDLIELGLDEESRQKLTEKLK